MLYRRFFIVTLFATLLGLASSLLNAAVERDLARQGNISLSAQTYMASAQGL